MKPSIYIPQRELDKLERNCNLILKEISRKDRALLLKSAQYIRDGIREKINSTFKRKSGNLYKAVYAKAYPRTVTRPAVAFAGIRPRKAPHAHLLEYGHAGPHPAPPHPFFRPAVDGCREEVMKNIRTGLKKTVEGAL